MSEDERERGLYGKYKVERIDGSSGPGGKHENCLYFVLDLNHDPYALFALSAYAKACEEEFPNLAADLANWVMGAKRDFEGDGDDSKSAVAARFLREEFAPVAEWLKRIERMSADELLLYYQSIEEGKSG